ncbi:MAG TPA: cell division protein FtsA [Chloroflexota bacterium]|nr:cell division protein FtsA [Chloroflexota bacterium]
MTRERIVVGVDAGTTKVTTLIAEVSRNNSVHVIGVGVAPSRGLRKGVVVDIEQTVESIAASVEKAERISGYKVVSAFVGLAGAHVTSLNNRGVVAVSHPDRTITEDDVERVLDAAQVINVPSNREIVHAIPRHFIVDGHEGVRNPVALLGYRLDVEAHIVTGAVTAIQNLTKCFHRIGIDVDQVVLKSLAASEAVLTDEEKEMGVALVDIGGGTTEIGIFVEGSVWHTGVLSVGGNHITNDLAVRFRTPFAEADELKIKHAYAFTHDVDPQEMVEVTTFGRSQVETVPRIAICEVAEARLQETFLMVQAEIKQSGYDGLLPAGVVLVGGTSQLNGIIDLASEVLQLPVRQGTPHGVHGLVDTVGGSAYATSVGLTLWGARYGDRATDTRPVAGRADRYPTDTRRAGGRFKGWLRAILP